MHTMACPRAIDGHLLPLRVDLERHTVAPSQLVQILDLRLLPLLELASEELNHVHLTSDTLEWSRMAKQRRSPYSRR